jgi:DNA-binding NarL/FixJ family response regulator
VAGLPADECRLVREVLGAKGFVLELVSSAGELRPLLRKTLSGSFDCVLIDSRFGDRPGVDTAAWILQQDCAVSCILVEEAPEKPLLLRALAHGAFGRAGAPSRSLRAGIMPWKRRLSPPEQARKLLLRPSGARRHAHQPAHLNGEKDLPAS